MAVCVPFDPGGCGYDIFTVACDGWLWRIPPLATPRRWPAFPRTARYQRRKSGEPKATLYTFVTTASQEQPLPFKTLLIEHPC